jgi:hypothetical protein
MPVQDPDNVLYIFYAYIHPDQAAVIPYCSLLALGTLECVIEAGWQSKVSHVPKDTVRKHLQFVHKINPVLKSSF